MADQALKLTTPIEAVPGVGPKRAVLFQRLGIRAAAHLLRHLPQRYEFQEAEGAIAQLQPGMIASTRGTIEDTRPVHHGRRRFEAILGDETGTVHLVWFNSLYLINRIRPGMHLRVQGKVQRYGPLLQLVNPKWESLGDHLDAPSQEAAMRPIYPSTEDLSSETIRQVIEPLLEPLLEQLRDHYDDAYRDERGLISLARAYEVLHRPDVRLGRKEAEVALGEARRRLAYDELFFLQLGVAMKRYHLREYSVAPALKVSEQIDAHIRARFPFKLTDYQDRAVAEITRDVTTTVAMNRLLQGDVGSGKTAVALYAMLLATANRKQAALMAPTELLAEQHFAAIGEMLAGANVEIALLTGSLSAPERRALVDRCAAGEVDMVVGTHALLTEDVRFQDLALVITDEQHRFGVEQRATLRAKANEAGPGKRSAPHMLVMTATPIPRTLSLTVFGDLDVSTIQGMPAGRSPIETRAVTPAEHDKVYEYARTRIDRGDQVYVVLPAIEESKTSGLRAVNSHKKLLAETYFAGLEIAAVHGQLKRATRERIMERFRKGEIQALIATTVIEVGVDVANATMMIVEHAERFGLAQLHQLRGRIGRGKKKSLCVLVAEPTTEDAAQRLEAIVSTTDGFVIAERDLEIRGMGEIVGTRQAGLPDFRAARLPDDLPLLRVARADAQKIIAASPNLSEPGQELLKRRLLKLHGEALGLADVG
jgi:ATP-dependent DNA helicase RecG